MSKEFGMYTVDDQGTDGKYRAWWIGQNGMIYQQLFETQERAEQWAEWMNTFPE